MFTELILDKLGVLYNDLAKKKHGNSPAISYGELVDRILADKGTKAGKDTFSELGEQTFNRMIRKVFPDVRLNGGTQTWFFYLLSFIEHKYCGSCDTIKPFSSFNKDKNNSSLGLQSMCKSCRSIEQQGQYTTYYASHQKSYDKNYGKIRERQNAYKGERSLRIPSWSQKDLIEEFYNNCPEGYQVDHIIPLKGINVSGLHVIENLQYLTAEENLRKSNKYEIPQHNYTNFCRSSKREPRFW